MDLNNVNIVSIDDNKSNLFLIESICLEIGLKVKSFSDSVNALVYCLQNPVDMILIDYMMPNLNGLEFIEEIRKTKKYIPIVMITAVGDDGEIHKKAFELGANEFLNKPVNATIFKARVFNLLTNHKNRILLEDEAKLLQDEVEKAIKNLLEREQETLQILGKTAEFKDPETASHVARVARYSRLLAKGIGLSPKEQEIIFYAAPFHDLGKVGIEDKILLKPGKLDKEEYETMKAHSKIGYEILKDSKSEYLQAGAIIALTHHEKFDGSGYPNALSKENIHVYGRIVAVADVFDALTSFRPYKDAWEFDDALKYLEEKSGIEFDPKIVNIFKEQISEVKEIYTSFSDKK